MYTHHALLFLIVSLSGRAFGKLPYVLNLLDANVCQDQAFCHPESLSSWGGNVIEGSDGKFHLFAAAFTSNCGLDQWTTNSEVIHAISSSPVGPFVFSDVALPTWHHNPQIIQDVSGEYLLFSIGMSPEGPPAKCAATSSQPPPRSNDGHGAELIELHHSTNLNGPWIPLVSGEMNLFNGTNPSPWVLPNGTIVVASHTGGLDVAIAPSYEGPYTLHKGIFFVEDGVNMEDPFIWFDSGLQRWRVLYHQYNRSAPHDGAVWVGGYAESLTDNILGDWVVQPHTTPAYTMNVTYVNGERTVLARRERPKLLFDKQGVARYLYNGVCPSNATSHHSNCFTMVVPIAN